VQATDGHLLVVNIDGPLTVQGNSWSHRSNRSCTPDENRAADELPCSSVVLDPRARVQSVSIMVGSSKEIVTGCVDVTLLGIPLMVCSFLYIQLSCLSEIYLFGEYAKNPIINFPPTWMCICIILAVSLSRGGERSGKPRCRSAPEGRRTGRRKMPCEAYSVKQARGGRR